MCFQSSSQICSYNLFYTHRQRQASHCCLFRSGEHVGMFPLLVKSRIFLCLMDRCANSLRAEEGCFEKQEKLGSAPAFVKMLTKREKKKEKKTWQNSASLLFLLSVSETRSPCPNLHRTTWFSLTGESKDKMNTHWQTHTHTYTHTSCQDSPKTCCLLRGRWRYSKTKNQVCVHARRRVCYPFPLRESLRGFPRWELTFSSFTCHFTDGAVTFLSQHTPTSHFEWLSKVFTLSCTPTHTRIHVHAHTRAIPCNF